MATPPNGVGTVNNPRREVRAGDGARRPAPPSAAPPRRWWSGLLIAALLVGLMIALSTLEATTCSGAHSLPCLSAPPWIFYGLHAAATLCCIWSIAVAARALIETRSRKIGAPPQR